MLNVADRGAIPNSVQDATEALQSALNESRHIYCPPGAYTLSGPLRLPDWPLKLEGAGAEATMLRWHTPEGGIKGEFSYAPGKLVTIDGLTLATSVPGGGTALELTFAEWPSYPGRMGSIRNVDMRPDPCFGAGGYWSKGIHLRNAWQVNVSDCSFYGNTDDNTKAAHGFLVTGKSIEVHVSDCHVVSCACGFAAQGPVQGFLLRDCGAAGVLYGVVARSDTPEPWTKITDSHFNAQIRGVYLEHRPQSVVSHCLLYANADPEYCAVVLDMCNDAHVCHNTIMSAGIGNGIAIAHSQQVQAIGNVARSVGVGVWLQEGATHCTAAFNRNEGGWKAVYDQGTHNTVRDNG